MSRAPSKRKNIDTFPPEKLFSVPSSVSEFKQFKELPEVRVSMCSNFEKIYYVMRGEIQPVIIALWTHNTSSEIGSLSALAVSRDDF